MESGQKKTILVGLTGRADSTVTAYLLKKQGHNVIGVSLSNFDKDDENYKRPRKLYNPTSYDSENKPDSFGFVEKLIPNCHLPDLKQVKSLCEFLEIPFYAVNATSEYREKVLGRVLSSGISGENFFPCLACHSMMIEILAQKLTGLKADFVATGHYAKLQFSPHRQSYIVSSSPDQKFDQGHLLGRLSQATLSKLILPLGDMRREEVLKIAKSLGTKLAKSPDERSCFNDSSAVSNLVERMTSATLRKAGQILKYSDDMILSDHNGLHLFKIGESYQTGKGQGSSNESLVKVIKKNFNSGTIYVADTDQLRYKQAMVSNYFNYAHFDTSRPVHGAVRLGAEEIKRPATFFFKNNGNIEVSFDEECEGYLAQGTSIAFYKDTGSESQKILGVGEIVDVPQFNKIYHTKEEDKDVQRYNYEIKNAQKIRF